MTPGAVDRFLAGFRFPLEDQIKGVVDFLKLLTRATTWVRIGLFVVGAVILLLGIKQFASVLGVPFPSLPGVPGL